MERKLAEQLLEKLNKLPTPLGDAVELIAQISDGDEKKRFQEAIGEVMAKAHFDLMGPIYEQYPDLYPFRVE